jgi:hypothetical protein
MIVPREDQRDFARPRRAAFLVGAGALALAALGGVLAGPDEFFRAWLIAVLLWVGIAVGCLAIALVHQLTGGQWGAAIERLLEAGARTIPWLAVAFVPLLFWLPGLYEWARPGARAEPTLAHKAVYLNTPFFVVRAAVYFTVWAVLARLLDRWSTARDRTADPRVTVRLRGLAAAGLMALGFTVSFAAMDWVMSLEATWYSTVFGAMVGIGWMLDAFAFVVGVAVLAGRRPPLAALLSSKVRIDLGNLLLTFVILWTYLAFVQLLIQWSGNIPEEVRWYVHRLNGGWQAVAALLGAGRFLLPLFVLLSRAAKRSTVVMAALGQFLVITGWLHTLWLVVPAFRPAAVALHALDVITPVALGGLWLALFFTLLDGRPLIAWQDPALPALPAAEIEHAA